MPNNSQSVAIPNPDGSIESHQACLMALKEAVEVLLNQRTAAAAGGGGVRPSSVSLARPVSVGQPVDRTQLLLDVFTS